MVAPQGELRNGLTPTAAKRAVVTKDVRSEAREIHADLTITLTADEGATQEILGKKEIQTETPERWRVYSARAGKLSVPVEGFGVGQGRANPQARAPLEAMLSFEPGV